MNGLSVIGVGAVGDNTDPTWHAVAKSQCTVPDTRRPVREWAKPVRDGRAGHQYWAVARSTACGRTKSEARTFLIAHSRVVQTLDNQGCSRGFMGVSNCCGLAIIERSPRRPDDQRLIDRHASKPAIIDRASPSMVRICPQAALSTSISVRLGTAMPRGKPAKPYSPLKGFLFVQTSDREYIPHAYGDEPSIRQSW
jgi:hypothetical protein